MILLILHVTSILLSFRIIIMMVLYFLQVHPVSTDDILKLSGGGDWHCAYLLLYGPRILKK